MKSGALMPSSCYLNLATWHTINAVYSAASRRALQSMRYDCVDPTGIDRLLRLIEGRAGHRLAMEVEASKIALSEVRARQIDLGYIAADLVANLNRAEFEQAICQPLSQVQACVARLLAEAGVSQVDTLFFTGGSSGIPALRRTIAEVVPNALVVEGDVFGSIGTGLAIEAHKRYGC